MEKIKADKNIKKMDVDLEKKRIDLELKKIDVLEKNKDKEMKKLQMVVDGFINFDQFLQIK
jgi:hypothetical protein